MEITPTHDLLFKKIFASESNKHILKHFVEDILEIQLETLQIMNPYHISEFKNIDEDNIDYTEVDILAQTEGG
ncbi:hypothetical protein CL176_05575 [Suicoccus acidiformans]|uniref:Transposase n=1 Tax=Suicoccus acidiformans TaxID=2036206 RepID=A0A347WK98_9LACT|nr:hypothetical protein CL176_05525 [Suicoccus acidiformans]AXY25505.1 hypothetical protein CL176_05575 [Suicoccus acidiformans]